MKPSTLAPTNTDAVIVESLALALLLTLNGDKAQRRREKEERYFLRFALVASARFSSAPRRKRFLLPSS